MSIKQSSAAQVASHKHTATRVNIPTEELRDFVAEDEAAPRHMLYPRDPSLDPQLVWKGKDEQDSQALDVPVAPIYIQEKIHPQALIAHVLTQAAAQGTSVAEAAAAYQLNFFADFDGLPEEFDQRVDFYQHDGRWSNRMILGDSLLVMTSLAEKEGLKGKVQMIYLDPPYGIKFGSNWQVSTRKRDVKDGKAEDATRQPEQVRAFRDTWKLGIHSYLAYLRDRLVVARELLTETGSVFVQIGDENVHLVRCLMDEVFGSENFSGQIAFFKTSSQSTIGVPSIVDHLILYAKNREDQKLRPLVRLKEAGERGAKQYVHIISPDMQTMRRMTDDEISGREPIPEGWKICRPGPTTSQGYQANRSGGYQFEGETFYPSPGRHWSYDPNPGKEMDRLAALGRLRKAGKGVATVLLAEDNPSTELDNVWLDTGTGSFTEDQIYVVQTGTKVIERCLLMTTDPGDLVLDPTCGSGTTAYVAEQWGRRWITCDTSRVALALARTRLMAAKYPYYLLADSPEGTQKEAELTGNAAFGEAGVLFANDLKKGFVYKRVPHVTLKSIANNEEIDAIHARWQEQLEPLRAELCRLAGKDWEEWQVPRELPSQPKSESTNQRASELLAEWWKLRRDRQAEIDASIARRADTEMLYDQPYENKKVVRVSGPFTVESLSPHRMLDTGDERDAATRQGVQREQDFATMILDNLRKAGVQNTKKGERLVFDHLDPYPGCWVQGAGEYTERVPVTQSSGLGEAQSPVTQSSGLGQAQSGGLRYEQVQSGGLRYEQRVRRVAVSIGPEQGTVGPLQVKEAAKEAVQGVGFDLLLVCGFAFDPHVSEEAKRYGKLTVLPAKMNPDLAMGDELLKKTGAGNLFMIFGEPDVTIERQPDGQIVIEIKGVDVYDPTTGEIRSSTTDDIACWFIDTAYDGEGFFVRHAYFTGADEPYDKLKRALRAEVDEGAWASIYSTRSRPFLRPATGKIAVKVINHYGDEVLKVFGV